MVVGNSQVERLTRVEEQVKELNNKVDNMDRKLDDLIALRNKGAGIFWLASTLFGTAVVGGFIELLRFFGVK